MASHRSQHNTEDIKRGIINIIPTLKDPRLKESLLSVISVEVSNDKSSCHIFVSSLDGIEHSTQACKILNAASGVIRKKLGEKLTLKYIPNLVFFPTNTIEYAFEISKKIENLAIQKNNDINHTGAKTNCKNNDI